MLVLAQQAARTLKSCDRHPGDVELLMQLEGLLDGLALWRDRLRAARWQGLVAS